MLTTMLGQSAARFAFLALAALLPSSALAQKEQYVFDTAAVAPCPPAQVPAEWPRVIRGDIPLTFRAPEAFKKAKSSREYDVTMHRWQDADSWIAVGSGSQQAFGLTINDFSGTAIHPDGTKVTYGCSDCMQVTTRCRVQVGQKWAWVVESGGDASETERKYSTLGIAVPLTEGWAVLWISGPGDEALALGRQVAASVELRP